MNQSRDRVDLWRELKELHFVTDFFSWLFALCSRLAEPLMLLCTLYIVAEAGVPAIAVVVLHNLSVGIMICAPEILLPGAFVVAARAQEHARLLFATCWTFVALTLLTLISLFVWHFAGASLAWLMCARCATAVGYSILMRVMSHGQDVMSRGQLVQQQVIETRLTERFAEIEANIQRTVAAQIAETEQRVTERLSEHPAAPALATITGIMQEHSQALADLAALPGMLEAYQEAVQEMKVEMEANRAERPKLSIMPQLPNDKKEFVRLCLTENPDIRNSAIQRKAREHGIVISPAYISEVRKAFLEEQSA